jgi:hypothetical protein
MLLRFNSKVLETYDPDWEAKWDRAYAMMRELEATDWFGLTPEDHDRLDKLRRLLPVVYDASHRTPNDYIRFHLSLTLQEADQLGIWAWLPVLPDSADIDRTRAAVAEVARYINAVKDRRTALEMYRRAGTKPKKFHPLPKLAWRTRWAMLRFRLGRSARLRGK